MNSRFTSFYLTGVCLAVSARLLSAQPNPERARVDLPANRVGPVEVEVDFFLLDVTDINDAGERFSASVYFNESWKDERLAFDAEAFGGRRMIFSGEEADSYLETIWSPGIRIANLISAGQTDSKVLTILSDGSVEYEVRLIGEFSSPMVLHKFPFDRQSLKIRLESFLWHENEMRLVDTDGRGHLNQELSLRGWKPVTVRSRIEPERYPTGDVYSQFTAELVVRREPWFIMWEVIFPLVLITFFGLTCFFWDQETLSERVAQALTCLLTATAQKLAVTGDLPKVAYFTPVDLVFLLTYATLVAVAVESTFVKFIHDRDPAKADRVDRTSVWAISLSYAAGVVAIFALS